MKKKKRKVLVKKDCFKSRKRLVYRSLELIMIKNIEDLNVWQKSRILNKNIYSLVKQFPSDEKYNIISQLTRATISICANIAEGFGRFHYQESINFYRTARGSLLEVRSHLYLAYDLEFITEEQLKEQLYLIDEIGKMLNSLITHTKLVRTEKVSSKLSITNN